MTETTLCQLVEQASVKLHEALHEIESLNQWKTEMASLIEAVADFKSPSPSGENSASSSLDPIDWLSARNVAHQMLDASLDHIQFIRDRPAYQPVPSDVEAAITNEPLPTHGQLLSHVWGNVRDYVIPYSRHNIHPRYWDAVTGAGTLGGVLADMVSAALNLNVVPSDHSPALVELTVID